MEEGRDTENTVSAVNLEPWAAGEESGSERTRSYLSSEAGNSGALVEHAFIDL